MADHFFSSPAADFITQEGTEWESQPIEEYITPFKPQQEQGPAYVWSETAQYPNPGEQDWAHYYTMGGTDPATLVYFAPDSPPPEGLISSPSGE
ncbi:hypothetical protein FRB96_004702 [Tulasnella sp. 330]|nr:hypothetical protein FRB96_004702 [Tulasnella sp. 330]KAG8871473.1 hypothetical protein FRB97_008656 [Tulasnella sp. 331]KAG8874324.1 hypothetical protein FRB98_008536 [Tulasnella sp. 332]